MMEYVKMKQMFLNVDLMVEIVVSHTGISLWTVKIVHVMNLLGFHLNHVSVSSEVARSSKNPWNYSLTLFGALF